MHRQIIESKDELNNIISVRIKKIKNKKLLRRYQGIRLFLEGYSRKKINKKLKLGYNTLTQWLKKIDKFGLDGLQDKIGKGRKSLLSEKQKVKLRNIYFDKPENYGFQYHKWTGKIFSIMLKEKFKINFKKSNIYKLLKSFQEQNKKI
jgi:transposase